MAGWVARLQQTRPGRAWGRLRRALGFGRTGYGARRDRERERYAEVAVVHDLPPSFHYWSRTHVRPMLREQGFDNPAAFFADCAQRQATGREAGDSVRVLSVGAGNCDLEVAVVELLQRRGVDRVHIECLELNPAMLRRGRALATARGVAAQLTFTECDVNRWTAPAARFGVVMANHSLHHVVELERLFDQVRRGLRPGGVIAVNDVIGRNGHQRWPEALAELRHLWAELSAGHRYNHQLRRQEDEFLDWDCSGEGFEGIRAQDILPLLLERFHVHRFVPFGNLIDPFVDRAFGPNFRPDDDDRDRAFLDRVHARDEELLARGALTPTHLYGVFGAEPCAAPALSRGLRPAACVRRADAAPRG
ncbi:MAG: class I SAM-dependent methyltransferase [Planctomycetota bacterium]